MIFTMLIFLTGCVPMPVYEQLQKKISTVESEKNTLKKELDQCGEKNTKLTNELKASKLPVKNVIDSDQLDEIKKRSLGEAEERYKLRIKRNH